MIEKKEQALTLSIFLQINNLFALTSLSFKRFFDWLMDVVF